MPPKKRANEENAGNAGTKKSKKGAAAAAPSSDNEGEEDYVATKEALDFVAEYPQETGELLFCGGTNWDMTGRKSVPKGVKPGGGRNLWGPHRLGALSGVKVRTVIGGPSACHCLMITAEGKGFTWGRNDKGQLGQGDLIRKDKPMLLESLKDFNIVSGSCGKNHTLVLTDKGHVYGFGENKMGQLGVGYQSPQIPSPTKVVHKGPPIVRVACGGEFSLSVDLRGNLYSFGCPEYGQLGHNTDGQYFVTSSKLTYRCETKMRPVHIFIEKTRDGQVLPVPDVEIVEIACGTNHSVAMDKNKRVYTWGFGGYGRLGHTEQKDEWVPRIIKFFDGPNRGCKVVAAGSSYTMAVNTVGLLYLWGQNKPTGEANMYPKPVQDLSGWKIRSIGCSNKSTVVAADDSVIAWGPSPTYGELGYGEGKPKSSTTPQEMKALSSVHVMQVTCGFGHTMMIARNESQEDEDALDKLPTYDGTP